MIAERAYAKINLFLDVISRRTDGFHDIKSVMHSLSLSDELTFVFSESATTEINLHIIGDDTIPSDDSNLVTRAAKKYLEKIGESIKIDITLEKNIPACAGLGGGSSDAAAALRALNCKFEERLSFDELILLASEIGSDVPYCLFGGTSLCLGRGETVIPTEAPKKMNFVIAKGKGRVSTPTAYKKLDELFNNFEERDRLPSDEALTALLDSLEKGELPTAPLYNIFEEAVKEDLPEVAELKDGLISLGATCALMSGSGPSVFGVFESAEAAEIAAKALTEKGILAISTETVE